MAKDFRRLAVVKGLEKVSQSGFSNLVLPSLLEDRNLQEKDKNFVTAVIIFCKNIYQSPFQN